MMFLLEGVDQMSKIENIREISFFFFAAFDVFLLFSGSQVFVF
jgi:hypothetical protein